MSRTSFTAPCVRDSSVFCGTFLLYVLLALFPPRQVFQIFAVIVNGLTSPVLDSTVVTMKGDGM